MDMNKKVMDKGNEIRKLIQKIIICKRRNFQENSLFTMLKRLETTQVLNNRGMTIIEHYKVVKAKIINIASIS